MNPNPTKHESPSVAVDVIIFSIIRNKLMALLIKRGIEPYKGKWAIPGGFILKGESLEDAARRELKEETGVKDVYLEQLYTFGEPKRDPRKRVVAVAYFALVPASKIDVLRAATDTVGVKWFPVYKMQKLAFDHSDMVNYAIQRLEWKMEYTNVVYSLMEEEFTLTDLQKVYEIIFNKKFDKRNFRRKIKSLGLIEATGRRIVRGVQRPAATYRFKSKKISIVDIT